MKTAALTAVYNCEQYVIQSLCASGDFDEVMVWDDCSTDLSHGLVQEYARLTEGDIRRPRIRLERSHSHLGQTVTKLAMVSAIDADAICFTDADDWRLPNTLAHQIKVLEAGADVAIAPVLRDSNHTLIQSPANPWAMIYQASFASIGLLFRTSAVLNIMAEWFDKRHPPLEGAIELQLLTELLLKGAVFAWSPSPVAVCRDRWSPNQAHLRSGPVRQLCRQRLLACAPDSVRHYLLALDPAPQQKRNSDRLNKRG
jgi:glycosyltransferase involved in cell wall biosynthesis